jgi:RNA polymerase sigma-70 factor, ECF subfamily
MDDNKLGSIPTLYDRHGPAIFRRCRSLLGTDDAAHDAVQEVFLRALRDGASFRGDAAPLTWLYASATLYCLQQLRNRGRQAEKLAAFARDAPPPGGNAEDRLTVAALIAEQPPDMQQIVILRLVDEMTVEEVAAAVGLSRKTVAKRIQRFLDQARGFVAPLETKPEVPA